MTDETEISHLSEIILPLDRFVEAPENIRGDTSQAPVPCLLQDGSPQSWLVTSIMLKNTHINLM